MPVSELADILEGSKRPWWHQDTFGVVQTKPLQLSWCDLLLILDVALLLPDESLEKLATFEESCLQDVVEVEEDGAMVTQFVGHLGFEG